ncbi:MAG TPA: glycosyltransferase family 4 protein [Terriglobales bacterium]|nr:glycosyltransferase family 4 protein [Terriglobales bacterium]
MSIMETIPRKLELVNSRSMTSPHVPALHQGTALPSRIAVVGNYLPRRCGIATFTTDLCEAVSAEYGSARLFAVPVNDTESGYSYPGRVRLELAQDDLSSYERAADFLNFTNFDLVCLQHEYGIFGGRAGSHILSLLRRLRMPVITTLHTVLREPNPDQRRVMEEIAEVSDRLIVMSELSSQFLQEIFKVPGKKIDFIPHGVPDLPFVDPNFYKDRFRTEGKSVLLTFGLLSPNKGIENVIQALPRILSQHDDVVYMVAGATHPHVLRRDGEQYRTYLQALAQDLGVASQVIFHNRFVSAEEMVELLGAADIYITPYRHEEQVVSGTLAYALGAGKAIISTPYWHAIELLDDRRGALVPFGNPSAIAEKTIELLDNDAARHAMRKRAYLYAREMVWSRVAHRYMESFEGARAERMRKPCFVFPDTASRERANRLPPLNLDHLRRLTDDTGIFQHAIFTVPNYGEGYTTDDNARALVLAVLLEQLGTCDDLGARYLAFLGHAFNPATGRFRNFLSYSRQWIEAEGSEDSHGRALWALGTVLGRSKQQGLRGAAGRMFESAVAAVVGFTSPRAWAFALLGIQQYLDCFPGDRDAQQLRSVLVHRLIQLYGSNQSANWNWFEDVLAYSNARLAHAVLLAGSKSGDESVVSAGIGALDWLMTVQRCEEKGHFVPIGSQGFYRKAGERARFDQQPVEAGGAVSACLEAYRVTRNDHWLKQAWSAFNWFMGENDLRISLYDATTGGCRDGLHPERANENQGAESTLAFLMALAEMRLSEETELSVTKVNAFESAVVCGP